MSSRIKVAVAQSHTLATTASTLSALAYTTRAAAEQGVDLILFPEAYLGGYPRGADFGSAIGSRSDAGREQFLHYFKGAVDLGDTPTGGGDAWVERRVGTNSGNRSSSPPPLANGTDPASPPPRGDGTREHLERIARETGVFIVTGLVERAGGSLYCSVVYVSPQQGCVGKRRKVMPTGTERLVWAQGSPSTLKAVPVQIKGADVRMGAAVCWENYMPLLRFSLYAQNINLYLAPTADARPTWLPLMQTAACEGRAFVLSANQCIRHADLPSWTNLAKETNGHTDATSTGSTTAAPANGTEAPSGQTSPSASRSPERRRRRTSVTVASGPHELCLPATIEDGEDNVSPPLSPRRRRTSVTVPSGPHELCLPSISDGVTPTEDSHSTKNPSNKKQTHKGEKDSEEFACRGGSCIIGPSGNILAGPLWEDPDGLLVAEIDFDDCIRGKMDFDAAGSYSRNDAFKLTVEGLSLSPP